MGGDYTYITVVYILYQGTGNLSTKKSQVFLMLYKTLKIHTNYQVKVGIYMRVQICYWNKIKPFICLWLFIVTSKSKYKWQKRYNFSSIFLRFLVTFLCRIRQYLVFCQWFSLLSFIWFLTLLLFLVVTALSWCIMLLFDTVTFSVFITVVAIVFKCPNMTPIWHCYCHGFVLQWFLVRLVFKVSI